MFRTLILFSATIILSGCAPVGAVDDISESQFELKSERLIVFKDGYCLVVKSGKAHTDANGQAYTEEVPDAAVLGSFWAITEKGVLKNLTAGWVDTKQEVAKAVDCLQTIEIVEANLGKECSFYVDSQQVRGKLLKVLGTNQPQAIDQPTLESLGAQSFVSQGAHHVSNVSTITKTVGNAFVIRTNDGDMVVQANTIRQLLIQDMETTLTRTIKNQTRQKRLTFQFTKPNSDVSINLLYFRPGVRWIPTYRVNLTDQPATNVGESAAKLLAEVNLQGELLNEAEDFTDMPIDVVVGVPNFRFKSIPSPMVLEATLQNLLIQAAPQIMGNQFTNTASMSNALYTQRMSEVRSSRAVGGQPAPVDLPDELSGKGGNDLFVYSLPNMTLKKGERATVPILTTKVPYRDIYTWDIELKHSETYAASAADSPSPLVLNSNKVWRQVELVNNTKLPWTTGAAMFVDGFQPLAQELLTYTSPGGICRVPVTVSVDLRGKAEDHETDRQLKAMRWRGNDYAQIKGEITAELANNKNVAVPIEVSVRFGGKAVKTSDDGKITLEPFRQSDWHNNRGDAINNSSRVQWKAVVEPGECFKPTVEYQFFIRY